MTNKLLKTNPKKKWQQGVALLFALGILGLLLVMALGFATNSIFDQMIASNNSSTTSAKVIADSGLERVRTMLQYYSDNMARLQAPYDFRSSGILGYSHSPDDTIFSNILVTARADMLSDSRFFGNYTTWNAVTMDPYINWIYLKSDGRLTGRMAYLILNRADIDPAKLVKVDVDESASPAPEVRLGAEANEINLCAVDATKITTGNAGIGRRFNYSYEVSNTQPNPGTFEGKWIDYQFMFRRFYDGDPNPAVIPALPGLAQFDPNPANTSAIKSDFQKWFVCNSKNSQEAFWIDTYPDGRITMKRDATTGKLYSEEQFHRFNLARNWNADIPDAAALYNKVLLSSAVSGDVPNQVITQPTPVGNLWADENFDGHGIPWLATFGMKDSGGVDITSGCPIWIDDNTLKGTFNSVKDRRHQIAANLVDYCKPVTVSATSDQLDWTLNAPTFTGNKRTPYIDEIGVALEAKADYVYKQNVNPNDTLNVTVSLNGYLLGKLIDIYSTGAVPLLNSFTLRVKGKISYTIDVNGVALANVANQDFTFDLPSGSFNWNNGLVYSGYGTCLYTFNGATLPATPTSADIDVTLNPTIITVVNNVSVTIEYAILYDATGGFKGYDYSTINKTAALGGDLLSANATKSEQTTYFSFQTEDPRQNLNQDDWYRYISAGALPVSAPVTNGDGQNFWGVNFNAGAYSGKVNQNGSPQAAYEADPAVIAANPSGSNIDKESSPNPAYVNSPMSTAFIREAPMVSPWELGFIHRGFKWQTLNLHKYDINKKALAVAVDNGTGTYNIFSAGGGAYSDGDANILDQIKMNTYAKNYKVDLRNKYQDSGASVVMNALFTNVLSGSSLSTTSPYISGGAAISAANAASISNAITMAVTPYSTRAQIVNEIAVIAPISTYATKAQQDEIIGKTVNLVDFDSYYTVIMAVQTIKDVGGNGTDIPINKKLPGDTTSTTVQARLGRFDKEINGTKYYFADEITSTLMVQALIHQKTDGSCEILSVNYIY